MSDHRSVRTCRLRAQLAVLTISLLASTMVMSGCGATASRGQAGAAPLSSAPLSSAPVSSAGSAPTSATTATTRPAQTRPVQTQPAQGGRPLQGMVVTIDPGHDGGNSSAPSVIGKLIWNGRENEACDTAGTETNGGFTEAQFNLDVAQYLEADLQALGATVVMTRTTNTGVGPCVTQRTAIGNEAHSDAAVSVHGDGGPADGRGFAILEPVADGVNDAVITSSRVLGLDVRAAFVSQTGMPVSTYDGIDAIAGRDDLAGLNLTTVPKILIECGNMRNATDAALLTSAAWQMRAAHALASGIDTFLTGRPSP